MLDHSLDLGVIKVNWSRYRPGVAQRVGRGIALLFHESGTRRGEWSAAPPGHTFPPGKTLYRFYRRLGGPQGRFGRVENLVPTVIRSRTVQPVVSRYTDWATGPTFRRNREGNIKIYLKENVKVRAAFVWSKNGAIDWIAVQMVTFVLHTRKGLFDWPRYEYHLMLNSAPWH